MDRGSKVTTSALTVVENGTSTLPTANHRTQETMTMIDPIDEEDRASDLDLDDYIDVLNGDFYID